MIREVPTKIFISSCFFLYLFTAKPAPLRNCTLRPYSSPSSSIAATTAMLSNSSSNLPFYVGSGISSSNQIVNRGQLNTVKELNYITTEYVKDKNLSENRKSSSGAQHHGGRSAQQQQQHYYHQRQSKDDYIR